MTKISWTDETWNPVAGCTKIAAGCKNCYAEKFSWRLACMGKAYYNAVCDKNGWNGNVLCRDDVLDIPLHWRKERKIFVCSMSDLFHPAVPFEFIDQVMAVIVFVSCREQPHISQILTKRPERMLEYYQSYPWKRISKIAEDKWGWLFGAGKKWFPENLWLGTSISTQADANKNIPILLQIPAAVRFVSYEPGLEGIDLNGTPAGQAIGPCDQCGQTGGVTSYCEMCMGIPSLDWVIIGCESGPKRRPCKLEWIEDAVLQCVESNVPVFVKQIEINGKVSKDPKEWPKWAQRQEYPHG